MGATLIEKHFTLDRSMDGPDHAASLIPDELNELVTSIRNIELAIGDGVKIPSISEANNISIIGTDDSSKKDIFSVSPSNSGVAIIVGSEGEGIRKSLRNECDLICKIPLYGSVDCLNVAVATGIALFHLRGKLEKDRIVK